MTMLHKETSENWQYRLGCLVALAALLSNLSCGSSAPTPAAIAAHEKAMLALEQHADTHVLVGPSGVGAARNRFLLMRKGSTGCAVRFTSFRRDHDWRPATDFSSGGENTYGEYDWYYQADGSFDFTKANVQSGQGKLRWGPHATLGHYGSLWGPSGVNPSINCGSFNVFWSYAMNLSFSSFDRGTFKDIAQIEFAPTRWTTLDQIDFTNRKLLWIGQRPGMLPPRDKWIPLEELP